MVHVALFNAKPQAVGSKIDARQRALGQASARTGDIHFKWTNTGKLLHIINNRPVFTGWEVVPVDEV